MCSQCEDSCSPSLQSRQVYCANEKGAVFPDDFCDAAKMPEMTKACKKPAPCEAMWHVSEWSECDRACGSGNRTRTVECSLERKTFNPSFCDADKKPVEFQNCNLGPCEEVKWTVSEWSGVQYAFHYFCLKYCSSIFGFCFHIRSIMERLQYAF
ncbi:hypothetical protein AVEN_133133-1 [Araneus ventricosus]|uniref:Uncharacterized protein n=2 Tax=Araneus ventricosus TaxID=182803 RepID=A0A4Y2WEC1_ARAVE|nr:hypothetical protein AVEN_133133-1 [Araneus ventricosus]